MSPWSAFFSGLILGSGAMCWLAVQVMNARRVDLPKNSRVSVECAACGSAESLDLNNPGRWQTHCPKCSELLSGGSYEILREGINK
jgi:ribosomal protein L37AE/L43A